MPITDDQSIKDHFFLYRGIKPTELTFDSAGNPVFSDGAFRSTEVSTFRTDKASIGDVFAAYQAASRIVCIKVQDVCDAGCIVAPQEPPNGHVCIYRKDNPGQRIGGGSAG